MKIKNNYTSHLGFGATRILPGEIIDIKDMPKGYGMNHPLIQWYISKKWLEIVGKRAIPAASDIKIDTDTGEVDELEDGECGVDGFVCKNADCKFCNPDDGGDNDNCGVDGFKCEKAECKICNPDMEDKVPYTDDSGGSDDEAGTNSGAGSGGGGAVGDNSAQLKPLSRMNRAELIARATELELEFSESDTNPVLVEKIRAAKQGDVDE